MMTKVLTSDGQSGWKVLPSINGGTILPSINEKPISKSTNIAAYNDLNAKKTIITTFNLANKKNPTNPYSPIQDNKNVVGNANEKKKRSPTQKQLDMSISSRNSSNTEIKLEPEQDKEEKERIKQQVTVILTSIKLDKKTQNENDNNEQNKEKENIKEKRKTIVTTIKVEKENLKAKTDTVSQSQIVKSTESAQKETQTQTKEEPKNFMTTTIKVDKEKHFKPKTDSTNHQQIVKSSESPKETPIHIKEGEPISPQQQSNFKSEKKSKVKRSSSESNIVSNEVLDDPDATPNKVYKSKSTRNIKSGKILQEIIKNRNTIRMYNSVPSHSMPPLHITNQAEVKKNFLESKIPPVLKFKADQRTVQNLIIKHSKTNYEHFFKAKNILDLIRSKYSGGVVSYYEANFGKRIKSKECIELIGKYLEENKITGEMTINFAPGLTCSGRIVSYNIIKNKPEARKFAIWINDGDENQFLRKQGIISLCDHEIGTHYYRAFNDGLQIWFSERKKFGLRSLNSIELLRTEEGLAALHTLMNANLKYLYLPALLYYLACMADSMTFEQLYNHMAAYIEIPDERWKLVTRVKRGISDPHAVGGYSRDQSYFEGAIDILQNLDDIDFNLLMSGKICLDELERIKRLSRVGTIKLPKFFQNMKKYKETLRKIGIANGIIDPYSGEQSSKQIHTVRSIDEDIRNSFESNSRIINEEDLFYLNEKYRDLKTADIKKYIRKEIVPFTKNTPVFEPTSNQSFLSKGGSSKGNHSSLCIII